MLLTKFRKTKNKIRNKQTKKPHHPNTQSSEAKFIETIGKVQKSSFTQTLPYQSTLVPQLTLLSSSTDIGL